jgi:hypothetical protein
MTTIGTVENLWRCPIKSMSGEAMTEVYGMFRLLRRLMLRLQEFVGVVCRTKRTHTPSRPPDARRRRRTSSLISTNSSHSRERALISCIAIQPLREASAKVPRSARNFLVDTTRQQF